MTSQVAGLKATGLHNNNPFTGILGCPTCLEILDDLERCRAEWESLLRCTERYHEFATPSPGPGGLLPGDQHRSRQDLADRGVQDVRQLPRSAAKRGKAQESKKGK